MKFLEKLIKYVSKTSAEPPQPEIRKIKIYSFHCTVCGEKIIDNDIVFQTKDCIDHAVCHGYDITKLSNLL